MTPLAALRRTKQRLSGSNVTKAYLMKASTQIWAGGLVGIDSNGLAVPLTTSCVAFAGVAKESILSAASGSYYVEVYHDGEFSFAKTGTIVQADVRTELYGADDATAGLALASLTTAMSGSNNDMLITAKAPWDGRRGELITIQLKDPAANSASLSVDLFGSAIVFNLATNGGGAITSTPTTIAALIAAAATPAAAAVKNMITIANAGADTGASAVTALGATPLALPGVCIGKLSGLDGSDIWASIRGAAI